MPRLNQRAWKILSNEVIKCTANRNVATEVQRTILLERLQKLHHQPGSPLSEEELRQVVNDIFPNFRRKVLQSAARANRPPGLLPKATAAIACIAGAMGFVWMINLPYPMIRRPIADTAPILLLPSYVRMDLHYRKAIHEFEQANQLVNSATSAADFELGATKVAAAQENLDALPVWFLGYEYPTYCRLFTSRWCFTVDEFQQLRKEVARMAAKIFQEQNALAELKKVELEILKTKELFDASDEATQQAAVESWQAAIDKLNQLPAATFAGRLAKTKIAAYQKQI